ncbi:MAG: hypothetical protein NC293_12565 [Roseburia sp.]|nr:hypothetical protein [Roseburia sp.]
MKNNLNKFYIYAVTIIVLFVVIISIIGNTTSDKQDEGSDEATTQTYSESHSQANSSDTNNSSLDSNTDTSTDDNLDSEEDDVDDSDFEESSDEEYEEPKSTKLFDEIYLPYATREKPFAFSAVKSYIKASGFKSKIVKPSKKESGKITVTAKNGDSVFFAFYECNSLNLIMSVSYHSKKTDREVSLSNYSDNNAAQYDKLTTHIIGDSEEEVESVDEQCSFLFAD